MTTPLHSRAEWGARAPRNVSHNITPQGITAHYFGPSPWGAGVDRSSAARFAATGDHARCASIIRAAQAFHMDDPARRWSDYAYTSSVCPHGHRFEGRGPGVRTAANGTNDGNQRSYAVVYLAGEGDPLTDLAELAYLDEAARLGQRLRWGHHDWKPTACPGQPLYAWRDNGFPHPALDPDLIVPGGPIVVPPAPRPGPGVPAPAFPLPAGWYFGPREGPRESVSGWYGHGNDLARWQGRMAERRWRIGADGRYGPQTADVARRFQREKGLQVDGKIGPQTWAAAWTAPVTR